MPCRYLWAKKESVLYKFNLMRIQYKEDLIWMLDMLHWISVKREKNYTYLLLLTGAKTKSLDGFTESISSLILKESKAITRKW